MFAEMLEPKIHKLNKLKKENGTYNHDTDHIHSMFEALSQNQRPQPIKAVLKTNMFNGLFDHFIDSHLEGFANNPNDKSYNIMKSVNNNKEFLYKVMKHNDLSRHEVIPLAVKTNKGFRKIKRHEFIQNTNEEFNEKNLLKVLGIEEGGI